MIPSEPPPATLRLRLDRDALIANWRTMDEMSGAARAGAAVKADAYGIGVDFAVPALLEAGARDFLVAHWSEVPAVLAHAEASRIAVLHGVGSAAEARYALASGVIPVINSPRQAALWSAAGGGRCHLMVDTGINRLGLAPGALGDPEIAALDVDILMSHLASADEDTQQSRRQLALFEEAARMRPSRRLSLANSAGIALGADFAFDITRPGLSLYGGVARPELAGRIAQVARLEAAVLQVRELSAGDSVGYNACFTATRPMRAATVSIGYADGILRCHGADGALRYDGVDLPILGKISMDMIVVDCTAADTLREGDFVEIPYYLPEIARQTGLSQYELLTSLGLRFDRIR